MKKSDNGERIFFLIKELRKNLHILARKSISVSGMSIPQYYAIRILGKNKIANMTTLKKELGMTGAFVTTIIDGLVKRGFATRKRDKKDRRIIDVSLTAKGMDFVNKMKQWERTVFSTFIKKLSAQKAEAMKEGLAIFVSILSEINDRFEARFSTRRKRGY